MHLTCRWFWGRWKEGGKDTPSPEPPQWHLSLQYTFHQFWWVALSLPDLSLETLHMIHATKTVGVRVHCWCNFWSTLPLEIYNLFNSVARLFKQSGSTSVYSNKMHKTNWKGLAWKKTNQSGFLSRSTYFTSYTMSFSSHVISTLCENGPAHGFSTRPI